MSKLREIITELPKKVAYDYERIEAAASFGDTLRETISQIEKTIGKKLTYESIADILAIEFDPEGDSFPIGGMVYGWLFNDHKPLLVENAKAVARALRLPAAYLTRFYKNEVSSPLYEKS